MNKTKIDPLVHQKLVLRPIFWRVKREKCRIWTLGESRKSVQQRAFSCDVVIEIGKKMELAMFYKARCKKFESLQLEREREVNYGTKEQIGRWSSLLQLNLGMIGLKPRQGE